MKYLISLLLLVPTYAWSQHKKGVIGVGNSGDLSFQLNFARATALSILRSVDVDMLATATPNKELQKIYAICRPAMYKGTAYTQFKIVDEIDDGQGYHAVARRLPGAIIEVSRTMLERISTPHLNTTHLIALILHEVGHDCNLGDNPVDDSYDTRLNELAFSLIAASQQVATSLYQDIELVRHVQGGEPVQFMDISIEVRRQLVDAYLDYLGDYIFDRFLSDGNRPAPASNYYASYKNSWRAGWHAYESEVEEVPAAKELLIDVVRATYLKDKFVHQTAKMGLRELPTSMKCESVHGDKGTALCLTEISFEGLSAENANLRFYLRFEVNIFSELTIRNTWIGKNLD